MLLIMHIRAHTAVSLGLGKHCVPEQGPRRDLVLLHSVPSRESDIRPLLDLPVPFPCDLASACWKTMLRQSLTPRDWALGRLAVDGPSELSDTANTMTIEPFERSQAVARG